MAPDIRAILSMLSPSMDPSKFPSDQLMELVNSAKTPAQKEGLSTDLYKWVDNFTGAGCLKEMVLAYAGLPHDSHFHQKTAGMLWFKQPDKNRLFASIAALVFDSSDPARARILPDVCSIYMSELFDQCLAAFPPPANVKDKVKEGLIGTKNSVPLKIITGTALKSHSRRYLMKFLKCRSTSRYVTCKRMATLLTRNILMADYLWRTNRETNIDAGVYHGFLQELEQTLYLLLCLLISMARRKLKGPILSPNDQALLLKASSQYTSHGTIIPRCVMALKHVYDEDARADGRVRQMMRDMSGESTCTLDGCNETQNLKKCGKYDNGFLLEPLLLIPFGLDVERLTIAPKTIKEWTGRWSDYHTKLSVSRL